MERSSISNSFSQQRGGFRQYAETNREQGDA